MKSYFLMLFLLQLTMKLQCSQNGSYQQLNNQQLEAALRRVTLFNQTADDSYHPGPLKRLMRRNEQALRVELQACSNRRS